MLVCQNLSGAWFSVHVLAGRVGWRRSRTGGVNNHHLGIWGCIDKLKMGLYKSKSHEMTFFHRGLTLMYFHLPQLTLCWPACCIFFGWDEILPSYTLDFVAFGDFFTDFDPMGFITAKRITVWGTCFFPGIFKQYGWSWLFSPRWYCWWQPEIR